MHFDPCQPFTRAEARAVGITDRRLAGPEYVRLLGGVYVSAGRRDLGLARVEAALRVHPAGAVATQQSAARVYGAPVPSHPREHVTVARPEDRRQRAGLVCHVAEMPESEVRLVRGLRVSSPERLFAELGCCLDLVDAVVLGDWLVRQGLATPDGILTHGAVVSSPAARRAASYVRGRVDSPMESRLRMLLVLAGLPEPVVNLELRDRHGQVVMRLDLAYPGVKLAVEYDGRHHAETSRQWNRDLERREALDRAGWRLLVVTSEGLFRDPEGTVDRVRSALRERGFRPSSALRPDDAWRPHFGR